MSRCLRHALCTFAFALGAIACGVSDPELSQSAAGAGLDCTPSNPDADVFDRAVCLCGDLDQIGNGITTRSFSSFDRVTRFGSGGDVGVNGMAKLQGNTLVSGVLDVAGPFEASGNIIVDRDVLLGQDLDLVGNVIARGDMWVGGDLRGQGIVQVSGELGVAGDLALQGIVNYDTLTAAGPEPHLPCPCAPDQIIDVAAEVATHRGDTPLALPSGSGNFHLRLEAGDYYTDRGAEMLGNAILTVAGAVRLYVESDLALTGNTVIQLEDGAELDLYVAGSLQKVGNLLLGRIFPGASRALRVFVGGGDDTVWDMTGNEIFDGAIYAPTVDIRHQGNINIRGALVARNVVGLGNINVDYDTALQGQGESCAGDGGASGDAPGDGAASGGAGEDPPCSEAHPEACPGWSEGAWGDGEGGDEGLLGRFWAPDRVLTPWIEDAREGSSGASGDGSGGDDGAPADAPAGGSEGQAPQCSEENLEDCL